jgi:hypothetical protein
MVEKTLVVRDMAVNQGTVWTWCLKFGLKIVKRIRRESGAVR